MWRETDQTMKVIEEKRKFAAREYLILGCLILLPILATTTLFQFPNSASSTVQQTMTTITFPTQYVTNCVKTNEATVTYLCVIMSVSGQATTLATISLQNPSAPPELSQPLLYLALIGAASAAIMFIVHNRRRRRPSPGKASSEENKLFCVECGFQNPVSNKFCGKCGKKLHHSE
jgi:beta-lactamase regulating signal transducer with metallopeptidase domain